jgi:hypothetical protein
VGARVRGRSAHLGARPRTLVCTILRGIETLVVAMNSCEVKCEYMTLYGQELPRPTEISCCQLHFHPSGVCMGWDRGKCMTCVCIPTQTPRSITRITGAAAQQIADFDRWRAQAQPRTTTTGWQASHLPRPIVPHPAHAFGARSDRHGLPTAPTCSSMHTVRASYIACACATAAASSSSDGS